MMSASRAYLDRISQDPEIMVGKPVVRGTRIPVERVLAHLEENDKADLFEAFPELTEDDVRACLACARGCRARAPCSRGKLFFLSLRFLIDASSDARHALHLRLLGHDVTRVGTHYPAAMKDVDILAVAYSEQRVLVTDDRDSGELVFRLRQPHAGVIYLRLDTTRFQTRARRVEDVLAQYGHQLDQFLVVSSWAELLRSTTER